jgi:coenzyme F420-0:L-glutamate ligase
MNIMHKTTRIFQEGENLFNFICEHIPRLPERSIVVVTSKIVALSERRTAAGTRPMERLIRKESTFAMRTEFTWLTIKDGNVMANAGIDASNARGKLILLPRDSFKTASRLRRRLKKAYRRTRLGVIITDSRILPLRAGTTGVALGYAGFSGIRNYRGTPDLFGRPLRLSRTDVADSLAAAAVLLMGEGRERHPLAVITDAPVAWRDRICRGELRIDPRHDLYGPLFKRLMS